MLKLFSLLTAITALIIFSCGTPNDPVSLFGSDGGYKIISKIATVGHAQDVVVDDTLAFVAQGEGGLLIISISNPQNPVVISSVMGDEIKGYSFKVVRKDSAIYLANGSFGVVAVDITNPLVPFVTQDDFPATPARNLYVFGIWLLTAVSENGIDIAKATVSTYPELRGGMNTPGFARGLSSSPDSNYILVACGEMGFALHDVSDMQNGYGTYPMIGWIDTPGYAEDVDSHPSETIAFLACGTGGFTIVNYADPTNPVIESTVSTGGYAKDIIYKDGKVFVATELRGLQIFDVTNVKAPVRLGTVPTEYALGISLDDQYIYVADEVEGLIIIAHP